MKICYFGIYDPEFGRNKVYIAGLRALGHEVVECRDTTPGLLKYSRLRRKHDAILNAGGYDVMIVGYPGHIVVPFARRISPKPVIFDALCTLYEGEVLSRGKYVRNTPIDMLKRWRINYVDEKAAMTADLTLVETEAQKQFFVKRFALEGSKVARVFTGADESAFTPDPSIQKRSRFTAVFRGKFLPEAGVEHIVHAAKLLEDQGVDFLIIGNGHVEDRVRDIISTLAPKNIEWLSENLPMPADLSKKMQECHVSLGQFGKHERLERTIPHKAFESLALGMPYVTARAAGVSELLTDGTDCLMAEPGDVRALADKILMLKNDTSLRETLGRNGRATFAKRASQKVLAQGILDVLQTVLQTNNLL
jgi:glycosyltransferase involved in cell wall biosynthesis